MRRSTTSRWTAACALVAATLLAACSGESGRTGLSIDAGRADRAPAAAPLPAQPSSAPDAGGTTTGRPTVADVPVRPSRIRTAEITVEIARSRDVTARADDAVDVAVRVGGEIDTDRRRGGRYATADLVLRVPPERLPATLRGLARLGHVTSRDASTRDVTAQVADVSSRVASARRAIARLRTLYADAPRVSDVISIEHELSSREADLESVQAQQRTLSGQVARATITVSLQTAARDVTPPEAADRSGFLGGLADGWDAFTRAATGVATGLGAALPFVALLVLLAGVGRFAAVRRRRPEPE